LAREATFNHGFNAALEPSARVYINSRGAAQKAALETLTQAVYKALQAHWSGRGLEMAAKDCGLLPAYQGIFRYGSSATHAADYVSPLGGSGHERQEIILRLAPGGGDPENSLISNRANLLLWWCARRLNHRFGLSEAAYIEAIKPPSLKTMVSGHPRL